MRRQVFPVLDACLVCCVPSCGRPGTGNDCIIAGLGTLGAGESDLLHAVPTTRLCGKKSKRNLCYFTRNRRVHLRVCTDKGWVTLDRLIERVDECETIYDRPVLYEIVGELLLALWERLLLVTFRVVLTMQWSPCLTLLLTDGGICNFMQPMATWLT